jgi:hypothetical protein
MDPAEPLRTGSEENTADSIGTVTCPRGNLEPRSGRGEVSA